MTARRVPGRRFGRTGVLARRGLDGATFASWQTSVEAFGRTEERVLAWAPVAAPGVPSGLDAGAVGAAEEVVASDAAPGVVIGGPGVLSVLSVLSVRQPEVIDGSEWQHVAWPEIEKGGWNGEASELTWSTYDGVRGVVRLADPGRLPELFRERIAASIAVEEVLDVGRGRTLIISGRRDPSRPGSSLVWRRTLGRGLRADAPGLDGLTADTVARLRTEYDPD